MRLVLLSLLLTACSLLDAVSPEERGIEVDYDIHKVYNQDKAMLMFESLVEDYFGKDLNNKFQDTTVWWTTTQCPYSDDSSVVYKDRCYYGIMWSCAEMYVALPDSGRTCGSALLHEYAHCLTMELAGGGWGDPEHKGDIWPIVAEANGIACDRGW